MDIRWSEFYSPYNEESVNPSMDGCSGVYLLWVKLKDGTKWKCFYVGRAVDLHERLLAHFSDSEENDCLQMHVTKYKCGYEYAEVPRQANRKGIEKFLYDHYSPECNQLDPGGEPIEVNLPN